MSSQKAKKVNCQLQTAQHLLFFLYVTLYSLVLLLVVLPAHNKFRRFQALALVVQHPGQIPDMVWVTNMEKTIG